MNRYAERGGEWIAQIHVAPAESRRVQHATECGVNHARHYDTNPLAGANLFVVDKHLFGPASQLLRQHVDVLVSLETTDDAKLFAHQIGNEDISARRANID